MPLHENTARRLQLKWHDIVIMSFIPPCQVLKLTCYFYDYQNHKTQNPFFRIRTVNTKKNVRRTDIPRSDKENDDSDYERQSRKVISRTMRQTRLLCNLDIYNVMSKTPFDKYTMESGNIRKTHHLQG